MTRPPTRQPTSAPPAAAALAPLPAGSCLAARALPQECPRQPPGAPQGVLLVRPPRLALLRRLTPLRLAMESLHLL